jgi:hypothetical protein
MSFTTSVIPEVSLGTMVDSAQNLWIQNVFTIAKFTPTGTPTVTFITGYQFSRNMAITGTDKIYVSSSQSTVFSYNLDGTTATPSSISTCANTHVQAVVDNSNFFYMFCTSDNTLRKYNTATNTFVSQVTMPINPPASGLAMDSSGNIWMSRTASPAPEVVKYHGSGSPTTPLVIIPQPAGNLAFSMVTDKYDNLLITRQGIDVRLYNSNGVLLQTIATNSPTQSLRWASAIRGGPLQQNRETYGPTGGVYVMTQPSASPATLKVTLYQSDSSCSPTQNPTKNPTPT